MKLRIVVKFIIMMILKRAFFNIPFRKSVCKIKKKKNCVYHYYSGSFRSIDTKQRYDKPPKYDLLMYQNSRRSVL